MGVISYVIKDNEKNEEFKITLETTKTKLNNSVTFKEIADFRKSRIMSLSTTEQINQKLLNK